MLFAMTIVVLKVIAMILENVEPLVFHLPTVTTAGDYLHHEFGVEWVIGCPGTVIELFICSFIADRQLAPRNNRRAILNFDAEASALGLPQFSDAEKTDEDFKFDYGNTGFGIGYYPTL